jgi:Tol biopolymer transport system component
MASRPTRRSFAVAVALALLPLLASPAVAAALGNFGPIELQSVGQLEQFESAGEAAISGDGRYLVFEGTLAGIRGIYRKDLESGQVQLVAGGSIYEDSGAIDASAPSISADGRYVSFTTATALVGAAHTGSNVYVRDMTVDPGFEGTCTQAQEAEGRCPYELASALNGQSEGIAYGPYESEPAVGANASARVSLSASGREIAFVIQGASDLGSGNPRDLSTPTLQVVVRRLDTHETVLVSGEREAGSGQMTDKSVAGGAVTPTVENGPLGSSTLPGASLSADGSTVAWLGANIPAQVPTLAEERAVIEDKDGTQADRYDEPLWRRIEVGTDQPTRRILGGGDPLAPGCPADGTLSLPACRGPFPSLDSEIRGDEENNSGWLGISGYDGIPQLSRDGETVALIGDPGGTSNVFVVDMHEGLDRVQALRQLTREIPVSDVVNPGFLSQYVATAGDVYEVAISPSGTKIAFTTQRQQFPLAPPNFTETPPAQLGVVELYQIDLANESLVRVSHGPDDGPSLEAGPQSVTKTGAATPSYTDNGSKLAFADTASNLVSGDANGASDVFTVTEDEASSEPGPVQIGPPPANADQDLAPRWRLGVVPIVHPDGSVMLDVSVPGAGRLTATATAGVPVSTAPSERRKKAGSARSARGGKRSGGEGRVELGLRTVGSAQMSTELAGLLELPLRVRSRYVALLSTGGGIYATIHLRFAGGGGPPLSEEVYVSLHRARWPARKGTAGSARARAKSRARKQRR